MSPATAAPVMRQRVPLALVSFCEYRWGQPGKSTLLVALETAQSSPLVPLAPHPRTVHTRESRWFDPSRAHGLTKPFSQFLPFLCSTIGE
jgi:hypothetical protein